MRCDQLHLELVEHDGELRGTALASTDTPGVSRGLVVGTRKGKGNHVKLTLRLEQINPHVSFPNGWVFEGALVDGELREVGKPAGRALVLARQPVSALTP